MKKPLEKGRALSAMIDTKTKPFILIVMEKIDAYPLDSIVSGHPSCRLQ